ncbi:hypothetical protein CC78DRAFT_575190 [Lojkania enalia]|uniref:Uncharacterized protein n=1 Tax=Lojkania enalia TaxID=147567 RepID=A0A9P4TMW2_9PLEO|nr:hypothetical protein CC78DRAFT_575190 [Didymosphaeria enalia]
MILKPANGMHIQARLLTVKGTILHPTIPAISARDGNWSKEALFGLLDLFAVILVPCIGMVLKCVFSVIYSVALAAADLASASTLYDNYKRVVVVSQIIKSHQLL